MPLNTNAVAGMFLPRDFRGTVKVDKASAITITRGDIMNRDTGTTPDSWRTAPTSGTGPFAWCETTVLAAEGKTKVSAIDYECEVIATNDAAAAIEPGAFVMTSATVAGRIMAWTGNTATNRICGVYLRRPGQSDGGTAITTLPANTVGVIRFLPHGSPVTGA